MEPPELMATLSCPGETWDIGGGNRYTKFLLCLCEMKARMVNWENIGARSTGREISSELLVSSRLLVSRAVGLEERVDFKGEVGL